MADPVIVACPAGQWTKVATAVTRGIAYAFSVSPDLYLQTYRDTGTPAPTDLTDAVPFTSLFSMTVGADADVYVWCVGKAGSIRFDIVPAAGPPVGTPFELQDLSYAGGSAYDPTAILANPQDIRFSDDGLGMFLVNADTDTVYEYSLSVAYVLSKAVYTGRSLSVTTEQSSPRGLAFSADGSKMYIVGPTQDFVHQYTLPTPWNLTGASYASKSLDTSSEEISNQAVQLSADGTKCYVVGTTSDTVYQYTLSPAWDISTGVYASKSKLVSGETLIPQGLDFSADGTIMLISDGTADNIFQYDLGTAWDVSTAVYNSVLLETFRQQQFLVGVTFSHDGLSLIIVGADAGKNLIVQYTLTTAYDITTAVFKLFDVQDTLSGSPTDVQMSQDKTKMYILDPAANTIYQFNLDTAGEISTAGYPGRSFNPSAKEATTRGFCVMNDHLYVIGNTSSKIHHYDLTAGNINTAVFANSLTVTAAGSNTWGVRISPDGTRIYYINITTLLIIEWVLTVPYEVALATFPSRTLNAASEATAPQAFCFNDDMSKVYINGPSKDTSYQYTMSTATEIDTATYDGAPNLLLHTPEDIVPVSLTWMNGGDSFLMCGQGGFKIFQYDI